MDKNPFQDTEYNKPSQKKSISSKGSDDLKLIEKINLLLEMGDDNEETSSLIVRYTKLNRVHENTKARRRLEKWASKVIGWYLIIVLLVVLANYCSTLPFGFTLCIPDNVICLILTTTTVNIIGLGLIVLRGHFPNKDNKEEQ